MMLAPRQTVAGLELLRDAVDGAPHRVHELEEAGHERRRELVGERRRLLGRELVRLALLRVADVAARGLGIEPLLHVALGGAGALRELGGGRGALRERLVEAEPIADDDEGRAHRRAGVTDDLAEESFEFLGVRGL